MQFNPLWRASGLATEANKPTAVIIFGLNAANLAGVNVWHHPFPIISTYCCTNDQGGNRDNDSLFTCSKDPQIAIWKNGQLLHLQFSQVYVCFQQLAWLSMWKGLQRVFFRGKILSARRQGRGSQRMKFQIPLTVWDSWPGMHTSPGLGRAQGFGKVIRGMCADQKINVLHVYTFAIHEYAPSLGELMLADHGIALLDRDQL